MDQCLHFVSLCIHSSPTNAWKSRGAHSVVGGEEEKARREREKPTCLVVGRLQFPRWLGERRPQHTMVLTSVAQ